jgi:hypothetical protein
MPRRVPNTVDERKRRSQCSNEYVKLAAPASGPGDHRPEYSRTKALADIRGQRGGFAATSFSGG